MPIDPDNDLRDPIISSGESTDDECEEVGMFALLCSKAQPRFFQQCDNYNLKSHRWCNNMSRTNLSGYVGHVTVFMDIF